MKPKFKLPATKLCTVVWYRDGQPNETLIDTPPNNNRLIDIMLGHCVGYSEIRAVKAVEPLELGQNFGRNFA